MTVVRPRAAGCPRPAIVADAPRRAEGTRLHHHLPTPDASTNSVTGIGGVCLQAKDAPALPAWSERPLGVYVQARGSCTMLDKIDDSGYGTFAWFIDSEGGTVMRWQPVAGP